MTSVKVESSMQLLTEINGYMFEHVKRTCKALNDPIESCTFLERMDVSGPSLLCLYSLSELTQEWNKLCTLKIWMAMLVSTFFFSFFFSSSFFPLTLAALLIVPLLMLTSKWWLILLSPVFRWSLAPYEVQHDKRSHLLLFYLKIKLKKTLLYPQKYNYWKSAPSVCPPPPPSPTLQTSHTHNCCSRYRRRWQCVPMGDNMCRERWHILATKYASTTGAFFSLQFVPFSTKSFCACQCTKTGISSERVPAQADKQRRRMEASCSTARKARLLVVLFPKGGWGCLMSSPCLKSQGCRSIPDFSLLSCFSA